MDRFVSTYTNRIDAKGRVSVPAQFRSVLARDGLEAVYVYPALDQPALDAGGGRLIEEITAVLERMPLFSDERDHVSAAIYGASVELRIDGDGRIVLPEDFRAHAGIEDQVTFVGLGHKFQLWEPKRFKAHLAEAKDRVREMKRLLAQASPKDATRGVGEE